MSRRDEIITLSEIATNIRLIRSFLEGHDQASFSQDSKTLYAVTRALEIISEAARRLSQEVKERNPTIAWRDVEDARTFTVTLIIKFSRTLSGTRRNACSTTS